MSNWASASGVLDATVDSAVGVGVSAEEELALSDFGLESAEDRAARELGDFQLTSA